MQEHGYVNGTFREIDRSNGGPPRAPSQISLEVDTADSRTVCMANMDTMENDG